MSLTMCFVVSSTQVKKFIVSPLRGLYLLFNHFPRVPLRSTLGYPLVAPSGLLVIALYALPKLEVSDIRLKSARHDSAAIALPLCGDRSG